MINRIARSFIARTQNWESKHFENTRHGKKIAMLKNKHKGGRCFIIGNGPSLTADDLECIHNSGIPSFAMNRVFNIFPQTKWRPTYYCSEDILILGPTQNIVNNMDAKMKFIPINLKWYEGVEINDAVYFMMDYHSDVKENFNLSLDCSHSIRCRGTVTSTCIQLAIYMGFSEIYLLGIDHNYAKAIDLNGNVVEDDSVKDYFMDGYDDDIKDQVVHDMRAQTMAFCDAEQLSRKLKTFRIFNTTRGGKLEVFERINFDTLFNQ